MIHAEITENSDKFEKNKREILKETKIACTNCGAILGKCLETKPNKRIIKQKHTFICPCGGESFAINTTNDAYFLSNQEYVVVAMDHSGNHFQTRLGKV